MPIATTKPLVKSFFFNDLASPRALASGSYTSDSGYYVIVPIAAGVDTSVEFNHISLYDTGQTATTYSLIIAGDPTGATTLWHGSGSFVNIADGNRVQWTPDVRLSNGIPDAVTDLVSSDQGKFYLLFKGNVNMSGAAVYGTYSVLDHNV
jgi:hypothetical protein